MKLLNGAELAGYIEERQAQQVRSLRQANNVQPKLVIICTQPNKNLDNYKDYGRDILVDVAVLNATPNNASELIASLNGDASVHGICIVGGGAEAIDLIVPEKDVDGTGEQAKLDPSVVVAVNWLLAGYNVDLVGKQLVVLGNKLDKLVKNWEAAGHDVAMGDSGVEDLAAAIQAADVVVCEADIVGLITDDMVKPKTVIVDAGEQGLGSLTICALFDNVIRAARVTAAS